MLGNVRFHFEKPEKYQNTTWGGVWISVKTFGIYTHIYSKKQNGYTNIYKKNMNLCFLRKNKQNKSLFIWLVSGVSLLILVFLIRQNRE